MSDIAALPLGRATALAAHPLPDLDRLPADALLDAADLARLLACSVRHIRRMDAARELPPPVRLGSLVRWRAGSVRTHLRDLERRARR